MAKEGKGTVTKLESRLLVARSYIERSYIEFDETILVVFLELRLLYRSSIVGLLEVVETWEPGDRNRLMSLITPIRPWSVQPLLDPTLLVIRESFWIASNAAQFRGTFQANVAHYDRSSVLRHGY